MEARFSLLLLNNLSQLMLYHRNQLLSLRNILIIDSSLDEHDIYLFNCILSSTIELNFFVGLLKSTGRVQRGLFNFIGISQTFRVVDNDTLTFKLGKCRESLSSIAHSFNSSAHDVNMFEHNI